jgi:hypothetical protein
LFCDVLFVWDLLQCCRWYIWIDKVILIYRYINDTVDLFVIYWVITTEVTVQQEIQSVATHPVS